MKIHNDSGVRPSRFIDKALNSAVGAEIGRLSDEDVHRIAICYAELSVAHSLRERWANHCSFVFQESTSSASVYERIPEEPGWDSVANETLVRFRIEQEQLTKESVLAVAYVALADRVIIALSDSLVAVPSGSRRGKDVARKISPLRHLEQSAGALARATRRADASGVAWNELLESFAKKARARNAFADDESRSVSIEKLDGVSAGLFEQWTAWLLERDNCTILRRQGGPNDQGADVIAITPDGRRIVLQCKHSTKIRNRVDPRYLHELNGTARPEHGADIVGIVTNRSLSVAAQHFALKHQICVIDRPVLKQWATYGVPWLPSNNP